MENFTKQSNNIKDYPVFSNIDLYYSLLYRDISKESLMILAESFTDKK
jgi:hypothetical protein